MLRDYNQATTKLAFHSNETEKVSEYDQEIPRSNRRQPRGTARNRLRAKKGPAPPLGNLADISYLEENFKPHLLRDVCTLCFGALVSDSLLHMLL